MRIEELDYNEAFWIVLDKVITPLKGWDYEISSDTSGWINYKKENVAYFSCVCNKDVSVNVKNKKYFQEVVNLIKDIEVELVRENLSNFSKEIVVKKDWDVYNLLTEGGVQDEREDSEKDQ